MLTSVQLRHFYLDLSDLDVTTSMALVHSRFSTNTFPQLGQGPSEPLYRPQRRNQYDPGQYQLAQRPRKQVEIGILPRYGKGIPRRRRYGQRLVHVRQLSGILVHDGPFPAHAMMMMIPEPWNGTRS